MEGPAEAETHSADSRIEWAQPCSGRIVVGRYRVVSTDVHLAGGSRGPARLQRTADWRLSRLGNVVKLVVAANEGKLQVMQ